MLPSYRSFTTPSSVLFAAIICPPGAALAQTADVRQTFPQVETSTPTGVNLQTGQFTERGVDMQFGPFSVDHFARYVYYPNGAAGANIPQVYATSLQGGTRYFEQGGQGGPVTREERVQLGEMQLKFHVQADGSFFPFDSSNIGWRMVKSGSTYVLTNKSGVEYRFSGHSSLPSTERLLVRKTEADGHRLDYTYNSSGQVKLIESNRGYALVFVHGSGTATVCGYNTTKVSVSSSSGCGSSDYVVTYGLNGDKLTSITDTLGRVTDLNYTGDKLTCVTLPNSSTCRISNTYATGTGTLSNRDQVLSQTTATGENWSFSHVPVEVSPGDYTGHPGEFPESLAKILTPAAFATEVKYKGGFLFEATTPDTGTQKYAYSLDDAFVVYMGGFAGGSGVLHYYSAYPALAIYPEGNRVEFARDYADNVTSRTEIPKPGSGETNRTVTWQYPTAYKYSQPSICAASDVLCDKPTRVTDYKGNQTDFVYNATYGGLLSKTLPADANGVRPQTRYTYAKKYAWTKSGGGFAQEPVGIWVLTREEYCRTSGATNVTVNTNSVAANCAAGSADEVVTTYEYETGSATEGSNLLLVGTAVSSEGVTLRTCFTYDEYGRKIAETKPKGTGGSCQ